MKSKCDAIYNTVKSSFGNTSSTSKQNFIDSFELINKLFIKWKDIDPHL